MPTPTISHKVVEKAIDVYYAEMARLASQGVSAELGLRRAFESLLVACGKEVGWTLVAEQAIDNRKRPDATLRDPNTLPVGYWEAKDLHDDLEAEIARKIRLKYPLTNIIFENSRSAVLYQGGKRDRAIAVADRGELADLLKAFFTHVEPAFERYDQAVAEFKDHIPDLARGLAAKIGDERRQKNTAFVAAYAQFKAVCQASIDPRISDEAIDEMLVQHLLTERLFRTVFDNSDFTRKNVIANEIERVIDALTSRSFNRSEFQAGLDRFYVAIENAARLAPDFRDKQTFLNTVYERFFQGYAVKEADTHGIVYTPQAIVDFMCASVESVLTREFGRSLSTPGVKILDPCTGTGNFIVNLLRRIDAAHLERKYREDLFANEIMLLPYYIASLNIEHRYYELAGSYLPFEGMCFVDTLALAEGPQRAMFAEANTARVEREREAEIMVIIGNPPYNIGQVNENDNNKNRKYPVIEERVKATYARDSAATNKNALSDAYVKFFRWAADRLQGRDGVVCYVSNNSFVDQIAFDGMRRHLLKDFTQIWHLDLHGNVRKNPRLSGTTHNVFGIQVGVGITIAVRASENPARGLWYHRVPEDWRKEEKYAFLAQRGGIAGIDWQELEPDENHLWLTEGMRPEFGTFLAMGSKTAKSSAVELNTIFKTYSGGVKTNRDEWAYDFDRDALASKARRMIDAYNAEVDRWRRQGGKGVDVDAFVAADETKIKWSRDLKLDLQRGNYAEFAESKIRQSLYRPFTKAWLFFDRILNEEVYQQPRFFPTPASEGENAVICVTDLGSEKPFMAIAADCIPDLHLVGAGSGTQCFPFYTYDEDGNHRQENITEWALARFRAAYGDGGTRRDLWHSVYAVLHHPRYRERYAENLKRELPRIPLVADRAAFGALVEAGARLAEIHTGYERATPYALTQSVLVEPLSWRVEKMALSRDRTSLTVNPSLRLDGIPAACFDYRLGNRSALDWVIDQYQVSTDRRSGITTDPNRADDPHSIVRLVGQVIAVSLETRQIVAGLPDLGLPG